MKVRCIKTWRNVFIKDKIYEGVPRPPFGIYVYLHLTVSTHFSLNDEREIDVWEDRYFYEYFIDIQKEREDKLKKILCDI